MGSTSKIVHHVINYNCTKFGAFTTKPTILSPFCRTNVGDCKVEIRARGWSRKSKKPIMVILLVFSVSFLQSFSDALIYNQWYFHFLWILRQPIQWNISVDCSRLVQPWFLRILLSCLRLSRIPWTLRRKLRISEAVNLSKLSGMSLSLRDFVMSRHCSSEDRVQVFVVWVNLSEKSFLAKECLYV